MEIIKIKDVGLCAGMIVMWALQPFFFGKFKGVVATCIGRLTYLIFKSRSTKSEKNIAKIFGADLSTSGHCKLARESFTDYWLNLLSLLPSGYERKDLKNMEVQGIDYLREAHSLGKGVILWQPSEFGKRNLVNQYLHTQGFSIHQVHSETHILGQPTLFSERFIKPFLESCERRYLKEIINLPGTNSLAFARVLAGRLERNAVLSISGDGDVRIKSLPVNFLGDISHFPVGIFSLAKLNGTPVLPVFCFRNEGGSISLIIDPPKYVSLDSSRGEGLEGIVTECVSRLESYVYQYPGQFRQWHTLYR